MLTIVTPGERLWEELRDQYSFLDGDQDRFRASVVEGLRQLQWGKSIEVDRQGSVLSRTRTPKKKADIVGDYQSFFSSATGYLKDREIDPQRVFPGLPDLEEILQKEVHPPRFLPTIARYTPTVGAIVCAVAGAVGGGHLFDYFFDNETVAYLGSGIGTVVGGIAGGFLAHAARLPLAHYLSAVDKQQTRHAYDIFLEQMEGWMSHYRPPDESM